jgi:hypothetical protein
MASKSTASEARAKVAQACLQFGRALLRVRQASVTGQDAQDAVLELFEWFSAHDALSPANASIAVESVGFGQELLDARKSSTTEEAIEAIQDLYSKLVEKQFE